MMKAKQKPTQLHDLLSIMQHEEQDGTLSNSTVRKNSEIVTENFWDELQNRLKFYREKNP
jgi:hypothetical protein